MAAERTVVGMASYGWGHELSTERGLFAEPYRFEFMQAVRLLEQIACSAGKTHAAPGSASDPSKEAVRLRAHVGFDFPASEVRTLRPADHDGGAPELVAHLFSLAGGSAPLPDWVAELLQQQGRLRDDGLRDFLDIFHHRLLSLLYRARLQHRPWLVPIAVPADVAGLRSRNPMSQYLLSFAGLGLAELQDRLSIPDEELLPYAGLLWQRPRSMVGLERILAHALGVRVEGRSSLGVWRRIEPEDRTHLGAPRSLRFRRSGSGGGNRSLGRTVTLGARVWDAQGRFDLLLGPLTLRQLLSFLPGRRGHQRLRALVNFYAGDLMDARTHLRLQAPEVPRLRLGRARLGWTSWIGSRAVMEGQTIVLPAL